jgi:hypothetical protein
LRKLPGKWSFTLRIYTRRFTGVDIGLAKAGYIFFSQSTSVYWRNIMRRNPLYLLGEEFVETCKEKAMSQTLGFTKKVLFRLRWMVMSQEKKYAYLWARTRRSLL